MPDDQVLRVLPVEHEGVVVAVLGAPGAEDVEGGAAVAGDVEEDVHLVDRVRVVRRGLDLLVVVGAGAAGDVGVPALPALAAVRER